MRFLALTLLLCLSTVAVRAEWRVTSHETLPSAPGTTFMRIEAESEAGSVTVHAITAAAFRHTIAVVDDPTGNVGVSTAGSGRGAVATVNGGYFQPDHEPLGLVLSDGQALHPLLRSPLLTGLVVAGPRWVSLLRVAEYKPVAGRRDALQAGPFLIDGGRPVAGLNATRSAARTVVFTAKENLFGLLVLRSATLAETAQILALPQLLPGHPLGRALNLDGGSSSGLWVRQPGTAFYSRELKTVRTYLSLVPR